jgi:hypothetical protein
MLPGLAMDLVLQHVFKNRRADPVVLNLSVVWNLSA